MPTSVNELKLIHNEYNSNHICLQLIPQQSTFETNRNHLKWKQNNNKN